MLGVPASDQTIGVPCALCAACGVATSTGTSCFPMEAGRGTETIASRVASHATRRGWMPRLGGGDRVVTLAFPPLAARGALRLTFRAITSQPAACPCDVPGAAPTRLTGGDGRTARGRSAHRSQPTSPPCVPSPNRHGVDSKADTSIHAHPRSRPEGKGGERRCRQHPSGCGGATRRARGAARGAWRVRPTALRS